LNSPITYYSYGTVYQLFDEFTEYCNQNFNPIGLYYHYRSLGEQNYTKYVQENVNCSRWDEDERYKIIEEQEDQWLVNASNSEYLVGGVESIHKDSPSVNKGTLDQTVKRNLFAARAICYARYIRKYTEMPPMDFQQFLDMESVRELFTDPQMKTLERLVDLKTNGSNEEIGNEIEYLVEEELSVEPDHSTLNSGEIANDRVNQLIENVVCD